MIEGTAKSKLIGLLTVSAILTLIGLIFVYSSSSVYALEHCGDSAYYVKKQLVSVLIGFFLFLICAQVPLKKVQDYSPLLVMISLGITLIGFIPQFSLKVHGSARWLTIAGFSFQPSELLIPSVLLFCAAFFAKRMGRGSIMNVRSIPSIILLGFVFVVLLKQPDFGACVTLFSSIAVLLFVAGIGFKYVVYLVLGALPFIVGLVYTKAYRLARIMIFLNPWADARGKGFQIIQSLIAIGSGQMWGLGICASRQKFFYLPMQHTDFIFAIIAEETGFMGSLSLIILFMLFCYFGIGMALRLKDHFARFITLGFVSLISVRAVINLMVCVGLLPTKGLGLPFISYGGSAIICLFCMLGLMVNMVRSE